MPPVNNDTYVRGNNVGYDFDKEYSHKDAPPHSTSVFGGVKNLATQLKNQTSRVPSPTYTTASSSTSSMDSQSSNENLSREQLRSKGLSTKASF